VINEMLDFIRFRICLTIFFTSASGYLLFNPVGLNLLIAALSSFFVFSGGYAYNNIFDRKEDIINRGRINPFVKSGKSYPIVFLCFAAGFLLSLLLPPHSIPFFILMLGANIFYSLLRIKRYTLLKNLYTGFGISLAFLFGAITGFELNVEVMAYYFLMSLLIFIGSVISDLRDYDGDEKAGINTIPVTFGFHKTKNMVYILLALLSFLVVFFHRVIVLLPFVFATFIYLYKNKISFAHSFGGLSLIALSIWLLL